MNIPDSPSTVCPYGLGDPHASLQVYIANVPQHDDLSELSQVKPLRNSEIEMIGNACGNGWRKVFNVYAKFVYALAGMQGAPNEFSGISKDFSSWQQYRDQQLLQCQSQTVLLFSKPDFDLYPDASIRIVMGRTYAKTLAIPNLVWLNEEFAISESQNLIVCPYFDYRQLSNIKIIYLCDLIKKLTDIQ
ncbi:hypothetical protein FE810_16030 [Thalassotalea litorea]|uniref:Uncharacterized protein n=2 Tax=Thalassotalea litorea TaxID=2020715 RepID=A0A5R9IEK7_9GAMM|nr:hypothetical protein FE810_16030 [Thalassotalea litorea]